MIVLTIWIYKINTPSVQASLQLYVISDRATEQRL